MSWRPCSQGFQPNPTVPRRLLVKPPIRNIAIIKATFVHDPAPGISNKDDINSLCDLITSGTQAHPHINTLQSYESKDPRCCRIQEAIVTRSTRLLGSRLGFLLREIAPSIKITTEKYIAVKRRSSFK